jgi:hypothetical protein
MSKPKYKKQMFAKNLLKDGGEKTDDEKKESDEGVHGNKLNPLQE